MILDNGYIKQRIETQGGGYDPQGNPIPVQQAWSEAIPCRVRQDYQNQIKESAMVQNPFTYAKYEILIDINYWQKIKGDLITLNYEGKEVGECNVIAVEPLSNVCMVRLFAQALKENSNG